MSDQRLSITINVINATQKEASDALLEAIGRLSAGSPSGDGEHYTYRATRIEDDSRGYGCDPNALPEWLFGGWEGSRREHEIDGQRWVRSEHLVLAVRGAAIPREREGYSQRLLAVVADAAHEGTAAAVCPTVGARVGVRSEAYLRDEDDGSEAYHYAVDIAPHAFAFALRYVALIERLYPGCSWWVTDGDTAQAIDVEGRVVACLMPTTHHTRHA